jgi:hypothetical protein
LVLERFGNITLQLNSIGPDWFWCCFVYENFVACGEFWLPSKLPVHFVDRHSQLLPFCECAFCSFCLRIFLTSSQTAEKTPPPTVSLLLVYSQLLKDQWVNASWFTLVPGPSRLTTRGICLQKKLSGHCPDKLACVPFISVAKQRTGCCAMAL